MTFNEIAICLAQKMAHAEETGGRADELKEREVLECFEGAEMGVIGKKPAVGTGATHYASCSACHVASPYPANLDLPPIDL